MAKFSLWFVHLEAPQLERTLFAHPLLPSPRLSERGRPTHIATHPYNFQWSPAVRALSYLFIKGSIAAHERSIGESAEGFVSLSGLRGSPALSLDHAMTKQPTWLTDMFGSDKHGDSLIRRLISRRNSGLKRPGPIWLYLIETQLPLNEISIYLDEKNITEEIDSLRQLNERILDVRAASCSVAVPKEKIIEEISQFAEEAIEEISATDELPLEEPAPVLLFPTKTLRTTNAASTNLDIEKISTTSIKDPSGLKYMLIDELKHSLRSIDIFAPRANEATISSLWNCDWFSRLAGKPRMFLSDTDVNLPTSLRLGCLSVDDRLERSLLGSQRITVALPAAMVGTLSILMHMKHAKGYNLDINYNFASTGELLHRMVTKDFARAPEICGLSIATAATLLGRQNAADFSPLMLTPKTSHRVICPRVSGKRITSTGGSYVFDTRETSTASHFFEDLIDTRIISRRKVSIDHMEAHEMPRILSSGDADVRAVLWFPFDRLNIAKNNCALLYGDGDPRQWKETILFASKEFQRDKMRTVAFDAALRNAWIEMIENDSAVERVAEIMMADQQYVRTIFRYTGMFDPEGAPMLGRKAERPDFSQMA